jgi:hypothetical protein
MTDLPRTTTTGDPRTGVRSRDAGAVDIRDDAMHHAEDARLFAWARGFFPMWKERLTRSNTRGEGVPPS